MDQVERQAETVPAARPGSAVEIVDVSVPEPEATGSDAPPRTEQADASEELPLTRQNRRSRRLRS